MIRSHDTAGGQVPWNCHRKCMESADSAVQKQLQFMIKTTGGTRTFFKQTSSPYTFNVTAFDDVLLQWIVVCRIRVTSQSAQAYICSRLHKNV